MPSSSLDRRALLEQARKLARQGKLSAAIEAYEAAVHQDPRDWNTGNAFADVLVKAGLLDQAVNEYARIGNYLIGMGFLGQARGIYKKLLRLRPGHEEALRQLELCAAENADSQEDDFHKRLLKAARGESQTSVGSTSDEPVVSPSIASAHVPDAGPSSAPNLETPVDAEGFDEAPEPAAGGRDLSGWLAQAMGQNGESPATIPLPSQSDASVERAEDARGVDTRVTAPTAWSAPEPDAGADEDAWAPIDVDDAGIQGSECSEGVAERLVMAPAHQPETSLDSTVHTVFLEVRAELLRALSAATPHRLAGQARVPVRPARAALALAEAWDSEIGDMTFPVDLALLDGDRIPSDASPDQAFAEWRSQYLESVAALSESWFIEGTEHAARGQLSLAAPLISRSSLTPHLRHRAARTLAQMFMVSESPAEALAWLEWAAMMPAPAKKVSWDLAFDMASALEATGQADLALGVLRELQSEAGANYPGLQARLRHLVTVC